MSTRTTSRAYWRHKGSPGATPSVAIYGLKTSFDPSQASAATGVVLPKGAIPLVVDSLSGGTGGTNPTCDVGTAADSDGFAAELDADSVAVASGQGALTGIELTEDTPVYAGVGASAATGGTTTIVIHYIMADDQSENS